MTGVSHERLSKLVKPEVSCCTHQAVSRVFGRALNWDSFFFSAVSSVQDPEKVTLVIHTSIALHLS